MAKAKPWEHEIDKLEWDGRHTKAAIKSCARLQKALADLLGLAPRNVVARKSTGYIGSILVYICYEDNLHHFKMRSYYVEMSEPQLLHLATQIRKILMPTRKPFKWEI